ncbi:alpha/beta hydrolase-fold protein [Antrihabitans stalactiti]|uniref:Esterase n=1 Tax=Antrihabitans stalactiti TaxID=2584121 RepID=A0A848KHX5_9NOCA|nr:esterase [Antrihabitans stalactiti]
MTEWSLLDGPLPWLITVAGVGGGLWLVCVRRRWFVRRAVPTAIVVAVVVTGIVRVVVERWWRPFPDSVPMAICAYFACGVCAVVLVVPRIVASAGVAGRVISGVAGVGVLLALTLQANVFFAQYPTIGDLLELAPANEIPFADVPGPTTVVTGVPLEPVWRTVPTAATVGATPGRVVADLPIPGARSGFPARSAQLYLPPAYFASPRPLLPVLILLPGQPGSPSDWFHGGRLTATMDAFAAAHAGLAPVVVVADENGGSFDNPVCLDSRLGNAATYLAVDVPDWVRTHLQVDPTPTSWAIAGISSGGTCALQMATNYPQVYPTFFDMSGDLEPTLGDRSQTVDAAFGGDDAAFTRVNPVDLMRVRSYPESNGLFVTGVEDSDGLAAQRSVCGAATEAEMRTRCVEVSGGHDWSVWSSALSDEMDWLATRLGLIP